MDAYKLNDDQRRLRDHEMDVLRKCADSSHSRPAVVLFLVLLVPLLVRWPGSFGLISLQFDLTVVCHQTEALFLVTRLRRYGEFKKLVDVRSRDYGGLTPLHSATTVAVATVLLAGQPPSPRPDSVSSDKTKT